MDARHEIVQFDSSSPIKVFMHKLGDVSRHWHESLELLLVLAGEVSIHAQDSAVTLQPDDIILINSNTPHELHAQDCVMIAVHIKLSKFQLPQKLAQDIYFDCNSALCADKDRFVRIKQMIASLLQTNAIQNEATLLYNRSISYALLSELVQNFKTTPPDKERSSQKYLDRLTGILQYINEHYQEQLTLTKVAEHVHLSAPYLSSFFEKHMGMNFITYYTTVRLDHATKELLYTDTPIEEIAVNCGFSDPRGFVRAFKKKYHAVPSAYRKMAAVPQESIAKDPLLTINYLNFKPENYLHILSHYLPQSGELPAPSRGETKDTDLGLLDCSGEGQKLRHTWRTYIGLGQAKDLLYSEIQQMVIASQREIGFRYIRFHGILSDDLMVCRRSDDGSLKFSFVLVDKILDFLLSVDLKPMIQFSFMPKAIAAKPERTVFDNGFIISPPRRMEEWNLLIQSFMKHLVMRYGRDELKSWMFSVWNEPDTSSQMFGFSEVKDYYSLYENTYRIVKQADNDLIFGTPSLFPIHVTSFEWLSRFITYTRTHNCVPEFVDVHYYADDFGGVSTSNSTFDYACPISADPNHFHHYLTEIRRFLADQKLGQVPLYVTEWNLTVSHRNLINDTCFKACHLAKNFLENYDRVESIGYWSLTDFIAEQPLQNELFHGGMGLFTQNGIKKPSYYAMQMMRKLGDILVSSGEGWFLTRRKDAYQMILYNYEHCDPLFTAEGFGLTPTQRDGVFPLRNSVNVTFHLTNLPYGSYRARETILNQQHGSCFDQWVAAGGYDMAEAELQWLRTSCAPAIHINLYRTNEGKLTYSTVLAPQEVRLIEFEPIE